MAISKVLQNKAEIMAIDGKTGMQIATALNLSLNQGNYLRSKYVAKNATMSAQDKAWRTRRGKGEKKEKPKQVSEKKVAQTKHLSIQVSGNTITWAPEYKCIIKLNEDGSILITLPKPLI